MTHILAVSPHLDDAVFSAGGTLARHVVKGDTVTVLTCFTGNVERPDGFALACQLDKGLGPDVDYMALRRAEDMAACAEIGADGLHWPFLEAPHRGYTNAGALFEDRLPDDAIVEPLTDALSELLGRLAPDRIYGPWGVGRHVDHVAVREALERVTDAAKVIWWEDYPYAMQADAAPADIVRFAIEGKDAERKLAAVLQYESQLGFQFGGAEKAREALADWRHEGFARTD